GTSRKISRNLPFARLLLSSILKILMTQISHEPEFPCVGRQSNISPSIYHQRPSFLRKRLRSCKRWPLPARRLRATNSTQAVSESGGFGGVNRLMDSPSHFKPASNSMAGGRVSECQVSSR